MRKSWWKLIDDYFNEGRNISYVVHLMDFRHGPLANDDELTAWLDELNMPRLVVFTKGDKISPGRRKGLYQQHMKMGIDSMLRLLSPAAQMTKRWIHYGAVLSTPCRKCLI